MKIYLTVFLLMAFTGVHSQIPKWQQYVSYKMDIDMNTKKYTYEGEQQLVYANHSMDTLTHIYYHLYPNAFQPGSEMDSRINTIDDPDKRMTTNKGTKDNPVMESRINKLNPEEIGYIKVWSLSQDGQPLNYKIEGTILEVVLNKPILPQSTTTFDMSFDGQVPVQIRRSGRNNGDGVALSMSQWYPKIAEYDEQGWHTDPYIAREFYGVWGDFDVKITIDKDYILGGSGYLQNANEIGYGYQDAGVKIKRRGRKNTWHFIAPNVHDFTWAADPSYKHDTFKMDNGVRLHFLYKGTDSIVANWKKLQTTIPEVFSFFEEEIGSYPWKQYSFIQGGDGGMEYAMCTLITGGKRYKSLEGTAIHELAHSWFQHTLATNESLYPWMDEGFTSYVSSKAKDWLYQKHSDNPYEGSYRSYYYIAQTPINEPATTHSDRYAHNVTYSINAYAKGQIFLSQLGYILGEKTLKRVIKRYYHDFKMRHPHPNDIIRTAEKVSGIHLHWYFNEFIETTHNIDYAIREVESKGTSTKVHLKRIGRMPMPLDIWVTFNNGKRKIYNIPLRMMRGEKTEFPDDVKWQTLADWAWAYPNYEFSIDHPLSEIKSIEIDPYGLMADIVKENNIYPKKVKK